MSSTNSSDDAIRAALEECLADRKTGVGLDLSTCIAAKVGTKPYVIDEWMRRQGLDTVTGEPSDGNP
jgi:hypothetical protein